MRTRRHDDVATAAAMVTAFAPCEWLSVLRSIIHPIASSQRRTRSERRRPFMHELLQHANFGMAKADARLDLREDEI